MTRPQLAALAVLSVFATALVLASASSSGPSSSVVAAVAQRIQAARAAAAAPPPAATPRRSVRPPAPTATPAPAPAAPDVVDTPTATNTAAPQTPAPAPELKAKPKASEVKHIFVIALTGSGYQQTFGVQSPLPYLATELQPQGAVLSNFGPIDGTADLPNYLALAGGLKPNAATHANCATYGDGDCVQPNTVLSLGDQVTSSGRSWRAYLEGMGEQPCVHPDNGTADATLAQATGYVTRHNPFVYFHSLLDLGDCQANDVDLTQLAEDLKRQKTTPNLAFIVPAFGDDPDAFLRAHVPQILDSAAYKDGALFIAFLSGPSPTGLLVLSPFARKASLYARPYDPYALLRSIEALFALDALDQAKKAPSFAKTVLTSAFDGISQP